MMFGPFSICPEATANFDRLVGLTIGPGWGRRVRERVGGTAGCTHLVELTGPMATTAAQTIWPIRHRERQQSRTTEEKSGKPGLIDSCHAFRSDGPVVKEIWPDHYTGDDRASG